MALQQKISEIFNLKQGEGKLVALPMLYSFFMGAALAFFVTAATSIFLSEFKREILPISFVASGLLMIVTGRIFGKIVRTQTFSKFVIIGVGFLMISVLLLLGLQYALGTAALVFIIYAWIRMFTYLHSVTFWSLIGRLFSLQQGKRLFSLITGGEVFGSLISFFSIPLLLKHIETEEILLISGLLLIFSFVIILLIISKNKGKLSAVKSVSKKNTETAETKTKGSVFLKNKYYKLFFLIAFLPIFAQFFVEFIFQIQAKTEFPEREMLTKFIGYFFGFSSLIEFILKTFFAGRMIQKYGVRTGLLALPAVLLFSIGLAAGFGLFFKEAGLFFAFIILARMFVRVVRTAFNDPATQILYQPLPENERLQFQNKVESGPKAYATIFAGILLYIFARIESLTLLSFSFFLLVILAFWYRSAIHIYSEYKLVLRNVLENEKVKVFSGKRALLMDLIKKEIRTVRSENSDNFKKILHAAFPYYFKPNTSKKTSEIKLSSVINDSLSPETKQKLSAVEHLNHFKIYKTKKLFLRLMYDSDFEVRNKAIAMAGNVSEDELYEHLFRNFRLPAYRNVAENAMLVSGKSILHALNKFFPKTDTDPALQIRLLNAYQSIGTQTGINFLRSHIKSPNSAVRKRIISVLAQLNYTANYSESLYLTEELEQALLNLVYITQVLNEFHDIPDLLKISKSIHKEKEILLDYIYFILAVLYDSKAITLIRKHLNPQTGTAKEAVEAKGFALEIADFVFSENHKKLILPLFNSDSNPELVRNYRDIFPVKRKKIENRLIGLINSDISITGIYVKARALRLLAKYNTPDSIRILKANMVNPNPLIRELACHTLFHLNENQYIDFLEKNIFKYSFLSDLDFKIRMKNRAGNLLTFEKLGLLTGLELFNEVDEEYLLEIIANSEEMVVKQTETLILNSENKDHVYFVITGFLKSEKELFDEGKFVSFANLGQDEKTLILNAEEPSFLLSTKIWYITDLMAQSKQFTLNMLKYHS